MVSSLYILKSCPPRIHDWYLGFSMSNTMGEEIRLARKAKPKKLKIEQLNRTSVNDTTNIAEIYMITTKIAVFRH